MRSLAGRASGAAAVLAALAWGLPAHAGLVEELAEVAPLRGLRQASAPPTIPDGAYAKAANGSPVSGVAYVDGVSAGKGWGVVIMNAPIEAVWMALNLEENYPGRMPGSLTASIVLSGPPQGTARRLYQRMPLPVVSDRWWVVDTYHNGGLYQASDQRVWELYWTDATKPENLAGTSVDGAIPVAWTEGAWLLVSLSDGRTLAEYYAWTDPGGRLPAGPATRFASGAIKGFLGDIEAYALELVGADRSGFVRPDQTAL